MAFRTKVHVSCSVLIERIRERKPDEEKPESGVATDKDAADDDDAQRLEHAFDAAEKAAASGSDFYEQLRAFLTNDPFSLRHCVTVDLAGLKSEERAKSYEVIRAVQESEQAAAKTAQGAGADGNSKEGSGAEAKDNNHHRAPRKSAPLVCYSFGQPSSRCLVVGRPALLEPEYNREGKLFDRVIVRGNCLYVEGPNVERLALATHAEFKDRPVHSHAFDVNASATCACDRARLAASKTAAVAAAAAATETEAATAGKDSAAPGVAAASAGVAAASGSASCGGESEAQQKLQQDLSRLPVFTLTDADADARSKRDGPYHHITLVVGPHFHAHLSRVLRERAHASSADKEQKQTEQSASSSSSASASSSSSSSSALMPMPQILSEMIPVFASVPNTFTCIGLGHQVEEKHGGGGGGGGGSGSGASASGSGSGDASSHDSKHMHGAGGKSPKAGGSSSARSRSKSPAAPRKATATAAAGAAAATPASASSTPPPSASEAPLPEAAAAASSASTSAASASSSSSSSTSSPAAAGTAVSSLASAALPAAPATATAPPHESQSPASPSSAAAAAASSSSSSSSSSSWSSVAAPNPTHGNATNVHHDVNYAFFAIIEWPACNALLKREFGLEPKDMHITIAFKTGDVHEKKKCVCTRVVPANTAAGAAAGEAKAPDAH